MAPIAYVRDLQPRVRSHLKLRPDIEHIVKATHQRIRTDGNQREQSLRVRILVAGLEDPRISAVPVRRSTDRVRPLEPGGETVRHAGEERWVGRQENQPKGSAE